MPLFQPYPSVFPTGQIGVRILAQSEHPFWF